MINNITKYLIALLFVTTAITGTSRKEFKKSFPVQPNQSIDIRTVSSLDVKIRSWDKNEVMFDLDISINSSDNNFEEYYIETFDIISTSRTEYLLLEFEEIENGGWSIWDIFRLKFHFYVEKNISGEIWVPRDNPLTSDFRYGDVLLEDMAAEINIDGRSNELIIKNCPNIRTIKNDYGNVTISNSGGKLLLESRSSEVKLNGFSGIVKIDAPYSNVEIFDVDSTLILSTRSSNVIAKNIKGDLKLNSDYCKVEVENIEGYVTISDRSGELYIKNVEGLKIDIPYSKCRIDGINGKSNKPLEIASRSGNISIYNVIADIIIDDTYSNFDFKNITGNINLYSRSGEITGENIVGNWISETQYSSIKLKGLNADRVSVTNRSEPISIDFIKSPQSIDIKNEYGGVNLLLPNNYKGEVKLFATYADIDCDFPLKIKSQGNTVNAFGKVGDGGKATMNIETRSEDILIKKKKF